MNTRMKFEDRSSKGETKSDFNSTEFDGIKNSNYGEYTGIKIFGFKVFGSDKGGSSDGQ